jgi:hypothetical protein
VFVSLSLTHIHRESLSHSLTYTERYKLNDFHSCAEISRSVEFCLPLMKKVWVPTPSLHTLLRVLGVDDEEKKRKTPSLVHGKRG